jgi:ribosomal protein S13
MKHMPKRGQRTETNKRTKKMRHTDEMEDKKMIKKMVKKTALK